MMARAIRGLAAATLLVAVASPLAAQARQKEIRLDFVTLQTSDGATLINAGFPGTVALGIYMNKNIALEPQVGITNVSSDFVDGTTFGAGLFVPYYFAGDFGKSGLFLSPGIQLSKGSGDFETDTQVDYGVDLGFKKTHKERVSFRIAATFRDGDSSTDAVIGGVFGIGLFWR
jgi:hypothetical protein